MCVNAATSFMHLHHAAHLPYLQGSATVADCAYSCGVSFSGRLDMRISLHGNTVTQATRTVTDQAWRASMPIELKT
jgi:hypothetical protein